MDALTELRQSIIQQIRRQEREHFAQRALDLPAQVNATTSPLAASTEPGLDAAFATGYDPVTGKTITPFIVGMSVVGGDDVVLGS